MNDHKDHSIFLHHIKDALKIISNYTSEHTFQQFSQNEWDQAAIIRYFEIIGEATTKLDDTLKKNHSEIEWRDMTDFRNFLIHDYIDIDVKIVWETMTKDVPPLLEKIDTILQNI